MREWDLLKGEQVHTAETLRPQRITYRTPRCLGVLFALHAVKAKTPD